MGWTCNVCTYGTKVVQTILSEAKFLGCIDNQILLFKVFRFARARAPLSKNIISKPVDKKKWREKRYLMVYRGLFCIMLMYITKHHFAAFFVKNEEVTNLILFINKVNIISKPILTQARCINYRVFRYCFAYYERFSRLCMRNSI